MSESLADQGVRLLFGRLMKSPDAIYDLGYSDLPRCEVCGRAVAEADCDRDLELPASYRMCFRDVDGHDPTCVEGLRS